MNVQRRLLYTGAFLAATGAVLLATTTGALTADSIGSLLPLWPVAVVALGVALLLRGTRFAVPGGIVAAVLPGLLLGGAVAAAPNVVPPCGDWHPVVLESHSGTFEGDASVDLQLACGDMTVTTTPGSTWQLQEGNGTRVGPAIDATPGRLAVTSSRTGRGWDLGRGADVWQLALPVGNRLDLAAEIGAGRGRFDLAGAQLANVRLSVNAGDAHIDLSRAMTGHVSLDVNAGAGALTLPGGQDTAADISVNAGALKVCVPDGVGIRVDHQGALSSTTYNGLVRNGDTWESPGYGTAIHHADVTMTVSVGSVVINPEGGCK